MKTHDLLAQLGVYLQPGFLSPEECQRVIASMQKAELTQAGVYDKELGQRVELETRNVGEVVGSSDEFTWVSERFEAIREQLAERFHESLIYREGPTFLRYKPGDFFLPHSDNNEDSSGAGRRVTAVLFLNGEGPESAGGDYEGAQLTLYGLMSFPGAERHGFSVEGAAGLLVAFRSGTRHGVSKLTRGHRYCAVCWYRQDVLGEQTTSGM